MCRKVIAILVSASLLVGCSLAQTNNNELPVMLTKPAVSLTSTIVHTATLRVDASETTVTGTPIRSVKTPFQITVEPTYLNFSTHTPTPQANADLFLLKIVSPGPMSKVISPVDFIVHIAPGYTGTTRIELIGEDGAILFRKIFKTFSNIGYYTRIAEKIDFEIRGAAEVARLQISTLDSNGRMLALNSIRLMLQAVGSNQLTPANDLKDRLLLRSPKLGDEISGGVLSVSGEYQSLNNLPIIFDLIDINGTVLGSRLFQINQGDGNYQEFIASIPYKVTKKTSVHLIIRQSDERIEGLSYLFSLPIILSP